MRVVRAGYGRYLATGCFTAATLQHAAVATRANQVRAVDPCDLSASLGMGLVSGIEICLARAQKLSRKSFHGWRLHTILPANPTSKQCNGR